MTTRHPNSFAGREIPVKKFRLILKIKDLVEVDLENKGLTELILKTKELRRFMC